MAAEVTGEKPPDGDGGPGRGAGVEVGELGEGRARTQRRVLPVLVGTQVLGGVGVTAGVTVSALVATQMSGSETVGGMAQTSAVLGAALIAVPTARLAVRSGRRPALVLAYGFGALGAACAALAIALNAWPLLLAALLLFGGGSAANLAARYSATDLSKPGRAARDLSIVVWATTIGSVAGPNVAAQMEGLGLALGLPGSAGAYVLSLVVFALAAAGIAFGLRPDPLVLAGGTAKANGGAKRSGGWAVLRGSPTAKLAVASIVGGHAAMVSLMSMTPVHLGHGGATLTVVGIVISLHITGMYAFSPLVGWLADRIGRRRTIAVGQVQLLAATALAGFASPHAHVQLSIGLVLLGTGWSCSLVAGSALLTESVPEPGSRAAVQGLSDLMMNGGGAVGGIIAGAIVAGFSYGVLAAVIAVCVVPLFVLIVSVRERAADVPGRADPV